MHCPVCINDLNKICRGLQDEWPELSVLLNETINSLERSLISSNLSEMSLDVKEGYLLTFNRDAVIEKKKISVVNETLNSLKLLYNNFEEWNGIVKFKGRFYYGKELHCKLKSQVQQLLNDLVETFDSLNDKSKSPYNLDAILDPDYFKKSLQTYPTHSKHVRAGLYIGLAQRELEIIKESSKTNEMQKVILTLYLEKLKAFGDQVTSPSLVSTEFSSKKKSSKFNETNKICEIMKKCQRLIKDVNGFMQIATVRDFFNQSGEIYDIINEEGPDAIPEVLEFIESRKHDWINRNTGSTTLTTCRSSALRRLNTVLKLLKKFNLMKDHLKSSFIILGLKNIVNDTLKMNIAIKSVYDRAYYLTYKMELKPRIDIPHNFVRNDPVYEEIYRRPSEGFLIVYVHTSIYDQYLESLDWNPFTFRKQRKRQSYLGNIFYTSKSAWYANFTQDESCQISLDLADRYLMTKQKIEYDRESLAYRFDRFKPLKPYKLTEIYKILHSPRDSLFKRSKLYPYLKENLDNHINELNSKVTNRGQLIVFGRSMAMMKRSINTLRFLRWRSSENGNLFIKLVEQAGNEYLYAHEVVVKLLNLLRSNRRITFSFSANGPFIKKIDLIGLKVKDEFLEKVNSQVETLKNKIKAKEADLESIKDEKTHLKYLKSILTRIKAVPIKELEMTDADNIVILREIIEEFEFTNIQYGHF